jgi:hypothetical protein
LLTLLIKSLVGRNNRLIMNSKAMSGTFTHSLRSPLVVITRCVLFFFFFVFI